LERIQLLETRKNPQEELAFLKSLRDFYKKHQKQLKKISLENLAHYAQSLEEMTSLDSQDIFGELEDLEGKIIESLNLTADQKKLLEISNSLAILKQLFELKLGPREFETLEKNPADFDLRSWGDFLKKVTPSPFPLPLLGGEESGEGVLERIEKRIPEAKAFYLAAQKREDALIKNTAAKMQAVKDPIAALIIGGFHSEVLVQALKNKGYSVVVVMPRFTPADLEKSTQHYFEILKYKWNPGANQAVVPIQHP
jgi:hypothetical protein